MKERPGHEPVAIIGMSCRFPGADSPEAFWKLLEDGVDAVGEVPRDRWNIDEYYDPNPAAPGKMSTRSGAFLDQVDQFDAQFFGITPREAARLDPQQRLLLELSWEALENAGLAPDQLEGSETAIFAGITTNDYSFLQVPDLDGFNGHAGMGSGHCIAAGRLSYFYDFHGPNAAVDTACSSSLVAVHLACQSLRARECTAALAGGVNVMVAPHMTVFLSEWGVLAPDGRSKAFADTADGFGRGEGCGFVVLKLLSDALAAGDHVLAVIRGTAMNQDGRGTRFSASNASAQKAVVRKALADAAIDPSEISFIETHGTGTPIGDPIEVEALTAVLGRRPESSRRCALGSVKANVGHLEAAAGVAGLIKAVLCLQHDQIPRQLHIQRLNPKIHLEDTPFYIPMETADWPQGEGSRFAGVSSFGLSGTNTHVIVEDPPDLPMRPASDDHPQLLALSARTAGALREAAGAYHNFLTGDGSAGLSPADICYTAGARRSQHPYRMAVVGATKLELADRLAALGDKDFGRPPVMAGLPERLVMVFSGQGSQWIGMGQDLLQTEPLFRERIQECNALFAELSGIRLLDELLAPKDRSRLGDTEVAQPAILAVQMGLLALYESWGIRPDAVIGHSSGEVVAAYAAGIFSLEDALKIMYHRSRLMQRATGRGRMAAVGLPGPEAERAIAGYAGLLELAGLNGPGLSVIAGEPHAISEMLEAFKKEGTFSKDLGVNYAFHTRQMEPFLEELRASLADLEPREASIEMVSTVTGDSVKGPELTAEHWVGNIRRPVLFAAAADRLLEDEFRVFLEVGPHPVLGAPLSQCLKGREVAGNVVSSLRDGRDGRLQLVKSVGALYVAGCELELEKLFDPECRPVRLPNYPWQRRRHWISTNAFHSPPAAMVPSTSGPEQAARGDQDVISSFYDRVSDTAEVDEAFLHLTFAPLLDIVPGFSWMLGFYQVEQSNRFSEMTREAHRQMRDVLFRGIDFESVNDVLDFGCGYGTDLITLAGRHPHLRCDGYTLSPKQVELGNRRAQGAGVQGRVSLYCRDSAEDEFPRQYDLVIGFEVAHYIRDKHKLFSHIDRHLNDGGRVVLADFMANTVSEIRHEPTNSFFNTVDQWCDLLAQYKLRVVDCVDVSQEMANFLHDPDAERNLNLVATKMGGAGSVREHFASYDGLGKLFRKRLATYGLFTIQKDRLASKSEILRVNRERLANPIPYSQVVPHEDLAAGASESVSLGELARCLYELRWEPESGLPVPARNGSARTPATWIVLADGKGVGRAAAELLAARGDDPVLVSAGDGFERLGALSYRVNPGKPDDFRELMASIRAAGGPAPAGVIHLWGLDSRPPHHMTLHSLEADQISSCGSLLHTFQALPAAGWDTETRIWICTQGVHSLEGRHPAEVAQGALWGIGRTLALEQPALWGGLLDLDPSATPGRAAQNLVDELVARQEKEQVLYREEVRYVARLRPSPRLALPGPVSLSADATYLITGGLGGLGSVVAKTLVEQGARHLALVQRSAAPRPGSPAEVLVKEMESEGAQVHIFSADVSREDEVARVLAAVRGLPPLRGVIHTAGVLDDGILAQLDPGRLERVLAPKVSGSWNLHRGTLSDQLDFFVLFSSMAAVIGSPGQGNYAAANAAMDALANLRASEGLAAQSISWGPWSVLGMAAAQANRGQRAAEKGFPGILPEDGTQILLHLLGHDRPHIAVMMLEAEQLRRNWPEAARMPLLAGLSGVATAPIAAPVAAAKAVEPKQEVTPQEGGILHRIQQAPRGDQSGILEDYLREQTARVLQLPISDVDLRRPLNRMGIDSLMSVELRNHIESDLKVSVPLVSFLEGDALADLAAAIRHQLGDESEEADPLEQALQQIEQMSDEEVEALLAQKKQQLAP